MIARPDRIPFVADRRASLAAARELVTDNVVKTAICTMLARLDSCTPGEAAERHYGGDHGFQLVTRAASSPLSTTTASAVMATAQGTLAALSPTAAYARLLTRCPLAFSFNRQRKVMVPAVTAQPSDIGFVQEGSMLPVIGGTVSAATLEPRSLGCIIVFSREAFLHSLPNAETVMRARLASGLALSIDSKMFDATAGDAVRPPGLLNGISATVASTVTPPKEAMRADVAALVGAVSVVANGAPVCLVAHPKQAAAYAIEYGSSAPFEMFPSNALTAGVVIAIASNVLAHAVDPQPSFQLAEQAAIQLDTAPGAGSFLSAAPVQSLWQQGMVGLKFTLDASWALCTSSGLAWTQSVTW
jgi:hypothetical protein